jgi:nicotinamidase-related amidase
METMTLESKTSLRKETQTKMLLEDCFDTDDIAMISVDNTQTFENKDLGELYVNEWEQAARATKKIAEACKYYGITTINVLEEHPVGHISLAANYVGKAPFTLLSYDEVKQWTEENHGIGERAQFTLGELQAFLKEVGAQMLWPDHGVEGTQGVELTQPLEVSDFDLTIVKGTNPAREAYSGFDETSLEQKLNTMKKKILLVSGVATDYCVGKTALDGQAKWYQVYLINEAVRWVAKETTDAMMQLLVDKEVQCITTQELFATLAQKFA